MAYSHTNSRGTTYFLHSKEVTLKGGRKQVIYYFAKEAKAGAIDSLPEGYLVVENQRTGLPILKKG
jgi:YHS domain-containing protein